MPLIRIARAAAAWAGATPKLITPVLAVGEDVAQRPGAARHRRPQRRGVLGVSSARACAVEPRSAASMCPEESNSATYRLLPWHCDRARAVDTCGAVEPASSWRSACWPRPEQAVDRGRAPAPRAGGPAVPESGWNWPALFDKLDREHRHQGRARSSPRRSERQLLLDASWRVVQPPVEPEFSVSVAYRLARRTQTDRIELLRGKFGKCRIRTSIRCQGDRANARRRASGAAPGPTARGAPATRARARSNGVRRPRSP